MQRKIDLQTLLMLCLSANEQTTLRDVKARCARHRRGNKVIKRGTRCTRILCRYSPVRRCSASDSRPLKPDRSSAIVWVCGEVEAAILPP